MEPFSTIAATTAANSIWPYIVGAAGSVGAAGVSSYGSYAANRANVQEARRAESIQQANLDRLYREQTASAERKMQFEKEMYGSRYQMMREDMRRAGMNPAQAYMASPGGAPSGAQISGGTSQGVRPTLENIMAPAMSTALQALRSVAEIKAIQAQTETAKANAASTLAQIYPKSRLYAAQSALSEQKTEYGKLDRIVDFAKSMIGKGIGTAASLYMFKKKFGL